MLWTLCLKYGAMKEVGDDDAGQNRADGQLRIGEAAISCIPPPACRGTRGAGFAAAMIGSVEYRPPGNFVPSKGKLLESLAVPPGVETNSHNEDEIDDDDRPVDPQTPKLMARAS